MGTLLCAVGSNDQGSIARSDDLIRLLDQPGLSVRLMGRRPRGKRLGAMGRVGTEALPVTFG